MKKAFILLSLTIITLVSYKCSTNNEVKLPEPHQNFIGKWVKNNDLIISIKSDSIIISRFRDKSKVIEIPNRKPKTKSIKVIKNNELEYEIQVDNGSVFPINHLFTFNREDNTIKYGDKILILEQEKLAQ